MCTPRPFTQCAHVTSWAHNKDTWLYDRRPRTGPGGLVACALLIPISTDRISRTSTTSLPPSQEPDLQHGTVTGTVTGRLHHSTLLTRVLSTVCHTRTPGDYDFSKMDIPKINANYETAVRRLKELDKVDSKVGGALSPPHPPHTLAHALHTVQG